MKNGREIKDLLLCVGVSPNFWSMNHALSPNFWSITSIPLMVNKKIPRFFSNIFSTGLQRVLNYGSITTFVSKFGWPNSEKINDTFSKLSFENILTLSKVLADKTSQISSGNYIRSNFHPLPFRWAAEHEDWK